MYMNSSSGTVSSHARLEADKESRASGNVGPRELEMLPLVGIEVEILPETGKEWEREIPPETVSVLT